MSVNLTINGQTFAYPEVGDTDWGTSATLWATAATNGMLQKAGGTFTLLADVNFGATFGLVSAYYKSTTSNISTAGSVRLAQADSIGWRNNANSGNLLLSVSSDALQFNGVNVLISGLIVNADISASAAIAFSKLAALTSGNILVGNASNVATSVAMSGDITISNAGVTAIASGVIVNADVNNSAAIAYSKLNLSGSIVNADVNASAAIDFSKLATLTAGNVLLGNASNVPTSTALSGDITVNSSGVTAISSGVIVNADVNASAAIAGTKISPAFGNQIVSGDREFQFTQIATPGANPSSGKMFLYPKSDGNFYKLDSAGVEVQVGSGGGSGSGSLNIVTNPSAVSATTGWTAATNYTVSRDTSNSPLGSVISSCFAISTTTASTESSTSGVYAASLANPASLRNTKLQLSMYVTVPASSLGVWRVSVYNSGGARVALSTDSSSVTTLPAGFTGQFAASFDADSGATYTLSITQTTRTSANTLYVTNISIGNGAILQGAVVSSDLGLSMTPVSFGTVTGATYKMRRVGSWLHASVHFTCGTTTAAAGYLQLPTGITIDTNIWSTERSAGIYYRIITSGAAQDLDANGYNSGHFFYDGSATDRLFIGYQTASNAFSKNNVNGIVSSGEEVDASMLWIPIAEWAGSGTVNLASNGVEYASNNGTWDANATAGTTVYGPAGSIMGGALAASRTKIVRFQTPILATDSISVEIQRSSGEWLNAIDINPYTTQNSVEYGVSLTGVAGNDTDVQVNFSRYRWGGSTFGGAGTAWPSDEYWRVKKTSSGQAVGFGVVSENASGLMPANLSLLDNASATRLGIKSYAHGGSYNGGAAPTITLSSGGGTLSSVIASSFIPYQLQDLSWRMKFNFTVLLSSVARTSANFAVNGILAKNVSNYTQTYSSANNGNGVNSSDIAPNSNIFSLNHASVTTIRYYAQGDIELDSKPTWAY